MRSQAFLGTYLLAGVAALALAGPADAGFTVLYRFKGGSDGYSANALMKDSQGNLYGTTSAGGGIGCGGDGCGTAFKLAPDGTETVLHAFTGGSDGSGPNGLIEDRAGRLFGPAGGGGAYGYGTVFKLTPNGTEKLLYSFTDGSDGEGPGSLIKGSGGLLYGAAAGGSHGCFEGYGCGIVFKLTRDGAQTVLYTFKGGSDGDGPHGLIEDKAGNLYGLTGGGGTGCDNSGCGTAFKLAPDGTKTVLYNFCTQQNCTDGSTPIDSLIQDKAGNFYGVTAFGGTTDNGAVFKLASDGTETVLHSFAGGRDGNWPGAGLIEDKAGNLYGTTQIGGDLHCDLDSYGCGTVFKLAPDGTKAVLHAFHGSKDGFLPQSNLVMDEAGNLYGTASEGGGSCPENTGGCGTIFRISK